MFSNFLSFRDITLYVIPGNITAYVFLKILSLHNVAPFPFFVQNTTSSIGLLFIFASISTCIGFLQSQIIIKIYNWLIEVSNKNPFLIANLNLSEEFESNIKTKIQKLLNQTGDYVPSPSHVAFCNTYVLARTNDHSYGYSRRLMNFSLFATVIPVPFTLGLYYFLYKIDINVGFKFLILLITGIAVFYFCYSITIEFRKAWAKSVLFFFLSLPEDKTS